MSPCQRQATTRAFGMTIQYQRVRCTASRGCIRLERIEACERQWRRGDTAVFCLDPGHGCGLDAGVDVASSQKKCLAAHQFCLQPMDLLNPAKTCMMHSFNSACPMILFTSQAQNIVSYESQQLGALCAVITTLYLLNA
jgi:hypothetical protein